MPKKILLIEKDDFYIEVIGTFVKLFLQHQLEVVRSLSDALPLVRSEKPDLVILDLESGAESLDFTEKMRDEAATKRVPILALSQSDAQRDAALGRGCVAFLIKPFRVRELEAEIERLLAGA